MFFNEGIYVANMRTMMKFIEKTNLKGKYLALHIVAPFPILISEHLQITTKPIVHG